MSAIELYKKLEDGTMKPTGVYYCSECRIVGRDQDDTEWCHGPHLCACGNKVTQSYRRICDSCQSREWSKDQDSRELTKFEKARKITEAEYEGPCVYDGDRYFTDLGDMIEHYEDNDYTLPEYVWACENVGVPKANSENIVESLLENMWEDADSSDLNGLDELEVAIAAFNKANEEIQVWEPDYSTAILVNPDNGQEGR